MSEDEWEFPARREVPETRRGRLVRDGKGGARLVANDNIVEGEMENDGGEAGGVDPDLARDH